MLPRFFPILLITLNKPWYAVSWCLTYHLFFFLFLLTIIFVSTYCKTKSKFYCLTSFHAILALLVSPLPCVGEGMSLQMTSLGEWVVTGATLVKLLSSVGEGMSLQIISSRA